MRSAIGVDIGGTHVRAARVAEDGRILARAACPSARAARAVMDDVRTLVAGLMDGDVAGVGIGVPGQVDVAARRVLSGGYVDLSTVDPWAVVAAATGLPVVVENDGTMALLGEAAHGAARGMGSVVLLTIGTGIGGAALEGGRVLRGRATAGQLGHLVVVLDGRRCVCGRRGCVETESAGLAFARHLAEAGLPPDLRAEDLAARDDPKVRAALAAWAGPLRAAIDSLIATLAPEAVVIGGGAGAGMVTALANVPAAPSWFDAPVIPAALGDDAGVIGAAMAALAARGRRVVLVNGVPASGKSGAARALATATGWPILALDTLKEPFLAALQPVDRPFNRQLGEATYQAMFGTVADAPEGATLILDAWHGFVQPGVLAAGLSRAGVARVAEIWCEAPPDEIGRRYAARAATRPPGHPGADYVPELVALAARAAPEGTRPTLRLDTTAPPDGAALAAWARGALG